MIRLPRRWYSAFVFAIFILIVYLLVSRINTTPYHRPGEARYPPKHVNKLPTIPPLHLPDLQTTYSGLFPELDGVEDTNGASRSSLREGTTPNLRRVKDCFTRSWEAYKKNAWMRDELRPISGQYATTFGGWAATLVDSLDTLWLMGMKDEFEKAVDAAAMIDFSSAESEVLNVFETTIRYLGGYMGAYDISDGAYPVLLTKAKEVGDLLYKAFDTPNRMPITRWHWRDADLRAQMADDTVLVAELGSLSLEFTRLSQLTGDTKYYDAIYAVMLAFEQSQSSTRAPGLWPIAVNAKSLSFDGNTFTIGGMADSLYEYLPKQFMLLGGTVKSYQTMYEKAMVAMKKSIFFRPMLPNGTDVLIPGDYKFDNRVHKFILEPQGQHLSCFSGGMVALGAKLFNREADEMPIAKKLVDGCIWVYESMVTGIAPEIFLLHPCENLNDCPWDEKSWHEALMRRQRPDAESRDLPYDEKLEYMLRQRRLAPGFTDIPDRRYILRPEAIESIFVLYRLTGDTRLVHVAWKMFEAIDNHTRTDLANAGIEDVTMDSSKLIDRMESFWLAETLKYFYLIFSRPNVLSLDKFVL